MGAIRTRRRSSRCHHLRAVVAIVALVGAVASTAALPVDGTILAARGGALFVMTFTPERGLGPLFNHQSCVGCHAVPGVGGVGPEGLGTATRVGRLTGAAFDPLADRGGPVARARSVSELGVRCDLAPGIPSRANVTSVRNAPALHGTGLIDTIADETIAASAIPRGDGVHGRVHLVRDADGRSRIGRFGWKADTVTLRQFVADAFRNELGITSPLAPTDLVPASGPGRGPCPGEGGGLEDDGATIEAVTAFVASLRPPVARAGSPRGGALFATTGCVACHTPSLASPGGPVALYSDLLLHDLGPDLDDKIVQGQASGRDWRTTPLWGLGARPRLLHDGRARTIAEAVLTHGGEAAAARERFTRLPAGDREELLAFLAGL
jgi:CxxC motif-containing protein (DUF1111 family)